MKPYGRISFDHQLYGQAAAWLVEFRTGDVEAAGREEFLGWLRASPEHMRAYLELATIWNEGTTLDPTHKVPDVALLEAIQPQTNVVPLRTSYSERAPQKQNMSRSRPLPASVRWAQRRILYVGASLLLALLGALQWYWYEVRDVYATGVGERHIVALGDGSVIELNAQSRIRIRYQSRRREVDLLRGQALFNVSHDAARPFIVHTADSQVRAIGTQFDVYRKAAGTTVTVIQGTVALVPIVPKLREGFAGIGRLNGLFPANPGPANTTEGKAYLRQPPQSAELLQSTARCGKVAAQNLGACALLLTAGEQALVVDEVAVKQSSPDIVAATAWTQGHIVLHGTVLEDVAAEFNRYNTRHFVIRAPELLTFKVTGIFSSTDPTSLIRFLEGRPEMNVTETTDEIIISVRSQSPASTHEKNSLFR